MKDALRWSWRDAGFGAAIAAPGMLVIAFGDVRHGLALLVGVLVAAIVGLAPVRKQRNMLLIAGLAYVLAIGLGSFVSVWWYVALPVMFVLCVSASWLAARAAIGLLVLVLVVPIAGIGLSYDGLRESFGQIVLIGSGTVWAYALAMMLPEYGLPTKRRPALLLASLWLNYGIRLGLAAVTAAGLGFALGVDHVGWITGAALLVMRPDMHAEQLRAVGRMASVVLGALMASCLLTLDLPAIAIAAVGGLALIAMAALHRSQWYVTPFFTTFLVFWVLLYGDASTGAIEFRFWERTLETTAGVLIAAFYGLLLPWLALRRKHT
jgi:hypothetical protein